MSEDDHTKDEDVEQSREIFQKATHHYRMRYDWQDLIEDMIQDGKEQGVFDNLKGKGKPLNLHKSKFGQERDLAHNLLKDNNLTPAWIMNRNQISDQIATLRREMASVWARHEREFRVITDQAYRDTLTLSWDDACREWLATIKTLNQQIDNFNLKRPIANLELFKLSLERELSKLDAPRYLK